MNFTSIRPLAVIGTMTALLILASLTASAQTVPTDQWSHGTTLGVLTGASTSPYTTPTYGASVGWELNHVAEIEGVGTWLSERKGAQGFAADLKLLVNVMHPALVVPYVGAGAGLYVGMFDMSRATMPGFYQRHQNAAPAMTGHRSFTDPTAVVAAGANLYVARHFSVRPEVGMRFVINGSETYRVTTVIFTIAYHVEEHAVRAMGAKR